MASSFSDRISFPYTFAPLDEETEQSLQKDFEGYQQNGLMRSEPEGWIVTQHYTKHAENIYNLHLRKDDIFLVTFPKIGSAFIQEMVWLAANVLNYKGAMKPLHERFPCLDLCMADLREEPSPSKGTREAQLLQKDAGRRQLVELYKRGRRQMDEQYDRDRRQMAEQYDQDRRQMAEQYDQDRRQMAEQYDRDRRVDIMTSFPSPRFIKTHLPFSLLPPRLLDTCKVVYVVWDVKDVVVSSYYYSKWVRRHGFIRDFSTYLQYFTSDRVLNGPYRSHVLQAWEMRDNDNLFLLFYEDIVADLPSVIRRVSHFVNQSYTDYQVRELAHFLQLDKLTHNPAVRMGMCPLSATRTKQDSQLNTAKLGDWKAHFTCDMSAKMDKWLLEKWSGTGLEFYAQ